MSEREFSIKLLTQYIKCKKLNNFNGKSLYEFRQSYFYKVHIEPYKGNKQIEDAYDHYSSYYAHCLSIAISLNKVPNSVLDDIREWSIANL